MKMKYLLGLLFVLIAGPAFALPHDDSTSVKSTVKVFIPWNQFSMTADGTSILSLGTGTPRVANVNSLGIAAVRFDTAGTNGDAIHLTYPIPDNMCVSCPTKISAVWSTSSTTTSQTATWRALYSATALGEGWTAPATALDTPITADAVDDTAYGLNESPQGTINGSILERGDTLDIMMQISSASGLNPASDIVEFHGIYIEYTRELL